MARPSRLSFAYYPHHVIHCGNNRQRIFLTPEDYERGIGCQSPCCGWFCDDPGSNAGLRREIGLDLHRFVDFLQRGFCDF